MASELHVQIIGLDRRSSDRNTILSSRRKATIIGKAAEDNNGSIHRKPVLSLHALLLVPVIVHP